MIEKNFHNLNNMCVVLLSFSLVGGPAFPPPPPLDRLCSLPSFLECCCFLPSCGVLLHLPFSLGWCCLSPPPLRLWVVLVYPFLLWEGYCWEVLLALPVFAGGADSLSSSFGGSAAFLTLLLWACAVPSLPPLVCWVVPGRGTSKGEGKGKGRSGGRGRGRGRCRGRGRGRGGGTGRGTSTSTSTSGPPCSSWVVKQHHSHRKEAHAAPASSSPLLKKKGR